MKTYLPVRPQIMTFCPASMFKFKLFIAAELALLPILSVQILHMFQGTTCLYDAVTFLNMICPLDGQLSGGSKFPSLSRIGKIFCSSIFRRATAPREISNVVHSPTSFNNVVFATSIILSAIPT